MRDISRAEFLQSATFALVGLGLYGCSQNSGDATPAETASEEEAAPETTETVPEPDPGIWVVSKEVQTSTDGDKEEVVATEYELDEQGNLISTPMVTTPFVRAGAEYEYNENGWRTKMISTMPASDMDPEAEPIVTETEFQNEYDDQGRLVSTSWEDTSMGEPATYTNKYSYDEAGNISAVDLLWHDSTITIHYDEDGLMTERITKPIDGSDSEPTTITFAYERDEAGNLASCIATYDNGYTFTNTYTCDDNGNVIGREVRAINTDGEESPYVTTYEYEYTYIENPSMGARALNHLFENTTS